MGELRDFEGVPAADGPPELGTGLAEMGSVRDVAVVVAKVAYAISPAGRVTLTFRPVRAGSTPDGFDGVLYPDGYAGSAKDVLSPQAFLLLGQGLYAGLGVGTLYADGDFSDTPFFIARAGLDIALFPALHLDINANYEFSDWDGINELDDNVDTDTVTLGAALRFLL